MSGRVLLLVVLERIDRLRIDQCSICSMDEDGSAVGVGSEYTADFQPLRSPGG
ncbi:hypothetical protein KBA73_00750 [Patescibacteria group bacterium]|nr:hypothetical protein [Patescibacteria group bacterium]